MSRRIAAIALVSVACGRSDSPNNDPAPTDPQQAPAAVPLDVVWKRDATNAGPSKYGLLTWTAERETAEIRFSVDRLEYRVVANGTRHDTAVLVGGKKLEFANGALEARIDLRPAIGALTPSQALSARFALDPHASIEVRVPGHLPFVANLPPRSVATALYLASRDIATTPISFGSDDHTEPAQHSIFYGENHAVLGPAKVFRDVDWFAMIDRKGPRVGRTCAYQQGKFPLRLQDFEVIVVERRTAREVKRKLFAAPDRCPDHTVALNGGAINIPDSATISAWLDEVRR